MATATIATLSPTSVVSTPLATGVSFGHWNFDFTDAAGTKAPTQTGDGVTVTSAQFSVAASAAGVATFTITAVDSNGNVLGNPQSVTETLPFTLPATTFPAPTGAQVSFA